VSGTDVRASVLGLPWSASTVEGGVQVGAAEFLAGPVRLRSDREVVVVRQPAAEFKAVLQWAPLGLTLFAVAYAESLLRNIRRRRRARRVDVVGMAAVGAVVGVAFVLASWAVAQRDVGPVVLVAVLALTAGAGGLLAVLQAAVRRRFVAPAQGSVL
jgi:hypothetical protein